MWRPGQRGGPEGPEYVRGRGHFHTEALRMARAMTPAAIRRLGEFAGIGLPQIFDAIREHPIRPEPEPAQALACLATLARVPAEHHVSPKSDEEPPAGSPIPPGDPIGLGGSTTAAAKAAKVAKDEESAADDGTHPRAIPPGSFVRIAARRLCPKRGCRSPPRFSTRCSSFEANKRRLDALTEAGIWPAPSRAARPGPQPGRPRRHRAPDRAPPQAQFACRREGT
jgi:hypothetical protein